MICLAVYFESLYNPLVQLMFDFAHALGCVYFYEVKAHIWIMNHDTIESERK